jgi:alpha-N-acetylglucosamine transferase
MKGYECGSDQYIFSIMKEKNPSQFQLVGNPTLGSYGTLIPLLGFSKFDRANSTHLSLSALTNSELHLSKYAVMIIVTSDDYVNGANTLYYSLVAHWNQAILNETAFVALVIDTHNNDYIFSHLQGWSIVRVPLRTPSTPANVSDDHLEEQFTKLYLWNMTAFNRILYLDSDTLCVNDPTQILKNAQHSFGAVFDSSQGLSAEHYHRGVFTIIPRSEEFQRLSALRRGYVSEQGLISQEFQNRSSSDIFPFAFNGNVSVAIHNKHFWDKHYPFMRILHYTSIKPFSPNAKIQCKNSASCLEAIELWNNWFACVPE